MIFQLLMFKNFVDDAPTSDLEGSQNLKNSPILDKQVLDILEETYHKIAE